jgi:hypothetical protein
MALVANTWYIVNFTTPIPANNPPWDPALFPAIPFGILNAILTASTLLVFCVATDGTTVELAYDGGSAASIPDGAVTVSATPAMNTQSLVSGEIWYSVRSGTKWLWYSASSGVVQSVANSTTLGAFIS